MYIKRAIEEKVKEVSKHFKVVAVLGARQVGKTTMLMHLAEDEKASGRPRNYVSLDNYAARNLAANDPELFLQKYKTPLLIDEAQLAPELFPYIKMQVDQCEENGQYWLTGSQPLHLKKTFSESLAGRVAILEMLGLSGSEISGIEATPFKCSEKYFNNIYKQKNKKSIDEIYHIIWKGGLPGIFVDDDMMWFTHYDSYIDTYLMRDINSTLKYTNEDKFRTFLSACAAMTGQPLNYDLLAETAGIDGKTAAAWFSVLESSYIVKKLQPFTSNTISRLKKRPVIHFMDTGLCSYLAGWFNLQTLSSGALNGHILESYTYSEILKSYSSSFEIPTFSFLRTSAGKEIDLVMTENNLSHPIEIKRTATPTQKDIKNFSVMENDAAGVGCVLCLCSEPMPISKNVWSYPIWGI